jgi:hypothetical protein
MFIPLRAYEEAQCSAYGYSEHGDMLSSKRLEYVFKSFAFSAETIYRLAKKKAVKRRDHLTAPLTVKILPSGKIKISS